ncbi:MAG: transcription termination/antitermination protein NusA, partial [bacterium]
NEETRKAKVVVPDDELSLAIGKGGQNVRLTAKLVGYDIDVTSPSESAAAAAASV